MNKKFMLYFRVFNNTLFDEREKAEKFCSMFLENGEEFVPTRFGPNEPVRNVFSPDSINEMATLLSETSLHLLLKKTSPKWLMYISWIRKSKYSWYWSFSFGEEWLKAGRPDKIAHFLSKICDEFPALYAIGGLSADWFQKHDLYDPVTNKFKESKGSSLQAGTGLPGVYWYNFFGNELVDYFGVNSFEQLTEVSTMQVFPNGISILPYQTPDRENFIWRSERENAIIEQLGKEYFFDSREFLKLRPKKCRIIPNVTK